MQWPPGAVYESRSPQWVLFETHNALLSAFAILHHLSKRAYLHTYLLSLGAMIFMLIASTDFFFYFYFFMI